MKKIKFGTTNEQVSAVVFGCMRLNKAQDPVEVIQTAYDHGITFIDHADIYGGGDCETIFADALAKTSIKREDLFIQSKCGIIPGKLFDFSKEHIIEAVEGSLKRLRVDYLDSLLLHRPDAWMDPFEVNEAFEALHQAGKVRYFGVSNQNPMQIEFLKKGVQQPLVANQLQFGLMHTGMIDQELQVNMKTPGSFDHDGGLLMYSRLHDMTIQAWSPYQYGFFEGVFIGNEKFPELNQALEEMAEKYGITPTGLASAWILSHPANFQVIAGTMTPSRIVEIAKSSEVQLSKEDWYKLYLAAGNMLP
ncbi:MAG TPA: aldo/keto reductase [Enterococcus columbae]|nr:aldo/keto reductase [Enterococcus columbae]